MHAERTLANAAVTLRTLLHKPPNFAGACCETEVVEVDPGNLNGPPVELEAGR